MGVDVTRPKELDTHPGDEIVEWAREQLGIARSIMDNPGGGLLFATQTVGQVKSGLDERDEKLLHAPDCSFRIPASSRRKTVQSLMGVAPRRL